MSEAERYDVLVLGSGTAGKLVAWAMAKEGKRPAVVERKLIVGSCPNVACLPSKTSFIRLKSPHGLDGIRNSGSRLGQSPSVWPESIHASVRWSTRLSKSMWIDIKRWETSSFLVMVDW